MVNGKKALHYLWAVENHLKTFRGTSFEKCACCPGTSGRMEDDGRMKCSRCGAVPVLITGKQAKECNGTKPPPFNSRSQDQKPRAVFRRPEHLARR